MRAPLLALGLVAVLVVACGGSTVTDSGGSSSGGSSSGGSSSGGSSSGGSSSGGVDAGSDAAADAGYLACMDAKGTLDPSLKLCQSDNDCVIRQEMTDCCGTMMFVGVRAASAAQFDACEAAWALHFPGCGCMSGRTTTEDGKMSPPGGDGGAPQVHCTDFTASGGVCRTYTP